MWGPVLSSSEEKRSREVKCLIQDHTGSTPPHRGSCCDSLVSQRSSPSHQCSALLPGWERCSELALPHTAPPSSVLTPCLPIPQAPAAEREICNRFTWDKLRQGGYGSKSLLLEEQGHLVLHMVMWYSAAQEVEGRHLDCPGFEYLNPGN